MTPLRVQANERKYNLLLNSWPGMLVMRQFTCGKQKTTVYFDVRMVLDLTGTARIMSALLLTAAVAGMAPGWQEQVSKEGNAHGR
jgi:hypothetical protein